MGELIDIAMTREEAIKIVSNIYQTDKEKEALGVLIPELTESEDERIRKSLIELVEQFMADERKEKTLAYLDALRITIRPDGGIERHTIGYLENQKKPKPVVTHDENGDAILSDFEAALFSAFSDAWQTYLNGENVNVVEWAKEHAPELLRVAGKPAWSEEDKQWLSEVYFAIDHSMYSEVEKQAMKKYIDALRNQPKQELDEESSKVVLKAVELLNSYGNSLYNGSFEKESNAVYKVADSLKLISTQPKPEWSENEKQRLKTIAGYLRYKGYEEDAEFIESIPPQQKEEGIKGVKGHPDPAGVWKPSDGQLKALKYFLGQHRLQMDASTTQWDEYDNLRSLYDILCKIAKS